MARPIRVCVLQPVVPHYRTPLFERLHRSRGFELEVWAGKTLSGGPPADDFRNFEFRFREAPVRQVGPFFSQPAALAAVGAGFDSIIFGWNARYLELVPALALARKRGVGTVAWGHGVSPRGNSFRRWARNSVGSLADVRLLYGARAAEELRHELGDSYPVLVAANAIDQTGIAAARSWWAQHPDALRLFLRENHLVGREIVLFVSRLQPLKRVDILIEAMARLKASRPRSYLVVIGDGPARNALEAHALRLGVEHSVRFLGPLYDQDALAPWYLSASVFTVPTEIGVSVLEAFGYGLPVVTCASPQSPEAEAIRAGQNGLVSQSTNPDELAQNIESLLRDDSLQAAMGTAAVETVSHGIYTLDGMVQSISAAVWAACAATGRVGASGEVRPSSP